MAAIVVDFASVRQDRRIDRSATDSAATGGAALLNPLATGGVRPKEACLRAWAYLATTLQVSIPSGACSAFNSLATSADATSYCGTTSPPPAEIDDDRPIGNRMFRVAWPIPPSGGSGFLKPEIAPGNVPQTYTLGIDGPLTGTDTGCDRLGVAVFETAHFGLGVVLGATSTNTQVHSVARLIVKGKKNAIAALNILDRTNCDALQTSTGKVIVQASGTQAGFIAVESNGHQQQAGSCPNNAPYVIDPQNNANNVIEADGPGATPGIIESYALNAAPVGNIPGAFDPSLPLSVLSPKPIRMTERYGETLVKDIYECTGTQNVFYPAAAPCTKTTNNVAALRLALGGTVSPTQYSGAGAANYVAPPGAAIPFRRLPDPTNPTPAIANFLCTTAPNGPVFDIPVGNWWINCPTLSLNNLGVFRGGTLVFDGGINIGSNTGCLVVNTPIAPPLTNARCPVVNATATPPIPPPASYPADTIIYMRGGTGVVDTTANNLDLGGGASLFLPRTFVFQDRNSAINVGAGATAIAWTAPIANDCGGDASCEEARFKKFMLWSDTTSAQNLGGQANLSLRGIFFTPQSQFNYNGQATLLQNLAQIWAWRLRLSGNNTLLRMAADPDNAISRPFAAVSLIR